MDSHTKAKFDMSSVRLSKVLKALLGKSQQ